MREIKFRGKRKNGEWVYGTFYKDGHRYYMVEEITGSHLEIDLDSVGQFTGLLDKNKAEIYEGDIVRWLNPLQSKESYKKNPYRQVVVKWLANLPGFSHFPAECEVIGNRWDNPSLLDKGEK